MVIKFPVDFFIGFLCNKLHCAGYSPSTVLRRREHGRELDRLFCGSEIFSDLCSETGHLPNSGIINLPTSRASYQRPSQTNNIILSAVFSADLSDLMPYQISGLSIALIRSVSPHLALSDKLYL
ncbi:unnamed protein product [Ilex paraguariensis]|uniref:Uncharacterized protein n=1 Tax=Ilex paraguariensis TaxID=185542 RepID=A0ABC8S1N1_9AQUA